MPLKSNIKFLFPNLFTALSLTSGLVAFNYTFEGKLIIASWLIAFSMVCDGLDGKLARFLDASSKFGFLFDTLSDFFVFGIVPGFLAYCYGLSSIPFLGAAIAIIYVFSGGFRLVRFTLRNESLKSKSPFTGLPIPAGAGIIAAFILVNHFFKNENGNDFWLLIFVLAASFLMISKIEYLSIEKKKKLSRESKFFILLALMSLILAIKYSSLVFAAWILIYVLYGLIRHFIMLGNER